LVAKSFVYVVIKPRLMVGQVIDVIDVVGQGSITVNGNEKVASLVKAASFKVAFKITVVEAVAKAGEFD
jgi:hypothetical protein